MRRPVVRARRHVVIYDRIFLAFQTGKTTLYAFIILLFPSPFTTSLFQFWLSSYDIRTTFNVVILRGFCLPFALAAVIFYLVPL